MQSYLPENSDIVMRVFLESTNKKIIGGYELQKIIDVFGIEISKKDKEKFLLLMQMLRFKKRHLLV
jgi:hypothetical protein